MIYDYLSWGFLGKRSEYEKEEGHLLQAQGEVTDLVKIYDKITAKVGNKTVTINCKVTEDGEEFGDAICSCGDCSCRHIAAVLYELKEETERKISKEYDGMIKKLGFDSKKYDIAIELVSNDILVKFVKNQVRRDPSSAKMLELYVKNSKKINTSEILKELDDLDFVIERSRDLYDEDEGIYLKDDNNQMMVNTYFNYVISIIDDDFYASFEIFNKLVFEFTNYLSFNNIIDVLSYYILRADSEKKQFLCEKLNKFISCNGLSSILREMIISLMKDKLSEGFNPDIELNYLLEDINKLNNSYRNIWDRDENYTGQGHPIYCIEKYINSLYECKGIDAVIEFGLAHPLSYDLRHMIIKIKNVDKDKLINYFEQLLVLAKDSKQTTFDALRYLAKLKYEKGNKEEASELMKKLIIDYDDYRLVSYKSYKKYYPEFYSKNRNYLLSKVKKNLLPYIYIEDKDYKNLLKVVNKMDDISRVYNLGRDLAKSEYRKEYYDKYKLTIIETIRDNKSNRKFYQEMCGYVQRLSKMECGLEEALDLINQVRTIYANRPALIEEMHL